MSQWTLVPEVRAVLKFFSQVAKQKKSKPWTWWSGRDNAPPSANATLPNTLGLWARRDVGKSAILQRAVQLWNKERPSRNFPGDQLLHPAWPFRADAVRDPVANVPVAVLGWLRESLKDKSMLRAGTAREDLEKRLDQAANALLKSDIASEYAAIGEALEQDQREKVLREARESTYAWGIQARGPLRKFFSTLRGGNQNVVMLPFDDLDISPTVGYQLLETIRLLFSDHPGVAVVLCGDYITLDAAIRAQLAKRAELEPRLLLVFAEQYIRKIVPRPIWVPRWQREQTRKITEKTPNILSRVTWEEIGKIRVPRDSAMEEARNTLEEAPAVVKFHNAPRVAVVMNWLWENFGMAWINRAICDDKKAIITKLDKNKQAALGLIICRLVSGQITGCETIQNLIDYPQLIARVGEYLVRWKDRPDGKHGKDTKWIPCEDGAWVVLLDKLMEADWQQTQTLVRWDASSGAWRTKARLNDWVCETLHHAWKLANNK